MAYSLKRRKIASGDTPDSTIPTSTSEAVPLQSLADRPLGFFSHGIQEVAAFISQGQRRPPKIEEVHVRVQQFQTFPDSSRAKDHAHRRMHRRQTPSGTGDSSSSQGSSPGVSVSLSLGLGGTPSTTTPASPSGVSVPTVSPTSAPSLPDSSSQYGSSPTTSSDDSSSTSSSSSSDSSSSPSSFASSDGSSNSTTEATSSSTESSTTTASDASAVTTSDASSSTTESSPNGMIGFSPTVSSAAPTTNVTASYPTSLVPAIISGISQASSNASLTTSPITITSGSTTFTSFTSIPISSTSSDSTDLFGFLLTTLSDGRVSTIAESRSIYVTPLPGGMISTSYGSLEPITTPSSGSSSTTASSSRSTSTTDSSASRTTGSSSGSSTESTSGSSSASSSGSSESSSGLSSASATMSSGAATGTAGSGSGATGIGSSPSPSSTNGTSGGSGDTNMPPAGVLAGGIVGGVAGLAALLLVALIFLRWYRRRAGTRMRLAGTAPEEQPPSRGGPGMAERTGLLPVAALFRNRRGQDGGDGAGERGFQRVGGRKLPSAFSEGMQGPSGPSGRPVPMPAAFESNGNGSDQSTNGRNLSNTTFFRDSAGFYGGTGESPHELEATSPETMHPGPARRPTIHPGGPYNLSPGESPPASPRANLLQGRAATPVNAPMSPMYPPRSETPASHGSRFTEEV